MAEERAKEREEKEKAEAAEREAEAAKKAMEERKKAEAEKKESEEAEASGDERVARLLGKWKGQMDFDDLEEDQRWVELTFKESDDGTVTGSFTTPRSVSELKEFEFTSKRKFKFRGVNNGIQDVNFDCKVNAAGSKLDGEIEMGEFNIEFSCEKVDQDVSAVDSSSDFLNVAFREESIQEEGDAVTGVWTSKVEMEEAPGGSMEFTIELKLDDDGKTVTGLFNTMMGDMEIYDGTYSTKTGKLRMQVSNEEAGMNADVVATIKGEKLSGKLTAGGGQFEVEFDADRKSKTLPSQEGQTSESESDSAQEATPRSRNRNNARRGNRRGGARRANQEEASQEEASEEEEAAKDDGITGSWEGKLESDSPRMQGDNAKFTMRLTMDKDGKNVSGVIESRNNEREITSGTYNAEKKTLEVVTEVRNFEIVYSGKVSEGKISGGVQFGENFSADFSAKRTSKTAPSGDAVAQSDDEPNGSGQGVRLSNLVPGPRWVSSIEASRHEASRVYMTLDGHRSNDDEPYPFVSEDYGKTWRSLRANLPTSAGSTRVLREDIENENLLFLGCEFSAWVSVDRGNSWTRFQGGLPTVAVHEFAIHPTAGEIVAGTHGRSLWVADITGLRKLTQEAMDSSVALMEPNPVVRWRRGTQRGSSGTRRFVGSNADSNAEIFYYIGEETDSVTLKIHDLKGDLIRELEAGAEVGLNKVDWDLRRQARQQTRRQGRGQRGGRRGGGVANGKYLVTLETANGTVRKQILEIQQDPTVPPSATSEEELELMKALEGVEDEEEVDDSSDVDFQ